MLRVYRFYDDTSQAPDQKLFLMEADNIADTTVAEACCKAVSQAYPADVGIYGAFVLDMSNGVMIHKYNDNGQKVW